MGKFDQLKEAFLSAEVVERDTPSMERLIDSGLKPPLNRERIIKDIKSGKEWHNNTVRLVASLVAEGWPDERILEYAPELTLQKYTLEETIADMQTMIDGARAKGFGVSKPKTSLPEAGWPTPFDDFDEMTLPRRRWIYGRSYLRRYVSLLVAPGGVGKTSMQIAEMMAIATGKPLLGEEVHERTNVWIINTEDSHDELRRRVLATMKSYDISRDDVYGRLYLTADRNMGFQFVGEENGKVAVNDELITGMISFMKENKIGVVVLDPFVGCHNVNENDNRAMNMVVSALRRIADETGAAISLVHHSRKLNGDDVSVDSVRGASSIIGAVRVARVVNRINTKDAAKYYLDENEAKSIYRVDDAKLNFAPPADETFWYNLDNVHLKNGDHVGVARPFDIHAAVPEMDDKVLERLRADLQGAAGGLRHDERSDEWVGNTVADSLGLDVGKTIKKAADRSPEQKKNRQLVKSYIDAMLERRWLFVVEKPSKKGHRKVKFVQPAQDLAQL